MMGTCNTKKGARIAVALFIAGVVLSPHHATYALGTEVRPDTVTPENFCKNIKVLSSVSDEIAAAEKRYEQNANARLKALNEIRADRDRARFDARSEREKNRLEHITKIESRAGTPVERAAISVFVKAVNTALTIRKTAYDAAVASFRTGINDAIKKRNTQFESSIVSFKKVVSDATKKAERDCRSGIDGKTARASYLSLLRDAQAAFKTSIENLGSVGESVADLAEVRDEKIQKAESDFIRSIDAAIVELRKSFPGA